MSSHSSAGISPVPTLVPSAALAQALQQQAGLQPAVGSASEPFSTPGRCEIHACEVRLQVGNENFYVCKWKLVHASEYFRTQLCGEGLQDMGKDVVELHDEKAEDVKNFLIVLFPEEIGGLDDAFDIPTDVLRLADKFLATRYLIKSAHFSPWMRRTIDRASYFALLGLTRALYAYNFDLLNPFVLYDLKRRCASRLSLKAVKKILADATDVSKEYATRVMRLKLDLMGDCFDKIRKRLEAAICSCAKDEQFNDCVAILDGWKTSKRKLRLEWAHKITLLENLQLAARMDFDDRVDAFSTELPLEQELLRACEQKAVRMLAWFERMQEQLEVFKKVEPQHNEQTCSGGKCAVHRKKHTDSCPCLLKCVDCGRKLMNDEMIIECRCK